ncbi:MAG: hypothetical protein KKG59_02730 [Nanoarchaeota archaeon]|nr:hypothetical protein [Nanoarchaeota archaeon]MBU1975298.1 hypothetical protein [Nanoarchaeota archaeon]
MKKYLLFMFIFLLPSVSAVMDIQCEFKLYDLTCDETSKYFAVGGFYGGMWDSGPGFANRHYLFADEPIVSPTKPWGALCCRLLGDDEDRLFAECEELNHTSDHILNINTTGDERGLISPPEFQGGNPYCLASIEHKVDCEFVAANPGDECSNECVTQGYETCLATFDYGQNKQIQECSPDIGVLTEGDTCMCCKVSDFANVSEGRFDHVTITPFCEGGLDDEICEIGEKIQAEIYYNPINFEGTVWIFANNSMDTCKIQKTEGEIRGMDYPCPGNQTCLANWTIDFIPEDCHYQEEEATDIFFYKTADEAAPSFKTSGSQNFTLGPTYYHSTILEIESNVTDPLFLKFAGSEPPTTPDYWYYKTSNRYFECDEKSQMPVFEPYLTGWGSCLMRPDTWTIKHIEVNLSAKYYVGISAIFFDSVDDSLIIEITGPENNRWEIHDYLNTSTNEEIWNGAILAQFTIPDPIVLDNTSTINISTTFGAPAMFYTMIDHINLSTNPTAPWAGNTEMKCGNFTDYNRTIVLGAACNVTDPPQIGMCENSYDYCVYGDEYGNSEGPEECYEWLDIVTNANQSEIECEVEQTWCPRGFQYVDVSSSLGGGKACVPQPAMCDYGMEGHDELTCEDIPDSGHPGFMNDVYRCLNDFFVEPIPEQEWPHNMACCEFMRIPAGESDYLFFNYEDIAIY